MSHPGPKRAIVNYKVLQHHRYDYRAQRYWFILNYRWFLQSFWYHDGSWSGQCAPLFFTMLYNLSSEMSDESNHGLRLVGQSSHTAVAYNAQSLDGSKVSVFNAFTHQCLVKEIATITIGRLSSKIPKSPLRNQAILLCFFSTASLYNGLLVLKTKEKHTFLKNFWILFQERKKTAFDLRNFALETKKEVWVSGRNRYSAKVLDLLGLEGSNPSASARFGSLAQLD